MELPVAGQTSSNGRLRHGEGWGHGVGPGDPCALGDVVDSSSASSSIDGEGESRRSELSTNRLCTRVAAERCDLWAGDLSELQSFVSVGGDLLVEVSLVSKCSIR